MRFLVSLILLWSIKLISAIFYQFNIQWVKPPSDAAKPWANIKMIIFLNHTSLFEPLYSGLLSWSFLAKLAKNAVAPIASKTWDRPIVGFFFKFLTAGTKPISRKRDDTWKEFLSGIRPESIICIVPEGRMKRPNGKDLNGNKMTVKPGVVEIIYNLEAKDDEYILFAYSGGLHHVQAPGQHLPKIFQTLDMKLEKISLAEYRHRFSHLSHSKMEMLKDLQQKLETHCPT